MLRRGERIPGSKHYRDFCPTCHEPIRVPFEALVVNGLPKKNYCVHCAFGHRPPPLAAHRPEGQAHGIGRTSG